MYDADLGRFLALDNYVQDPSNTQNFNRYQYAFNNPLKYIDPSGELFGLGVIFKGAIIGAATGALIGGISKGIKALKNDKSFWSGKEKISIGSETTLEVNVSTSQTSSDNIDLLWDEDYSIEINRIIQEKPNTCTVATLKSTDQFYGINRPNSYYDVLRNSSKLSEFGFQLSDVNRNLIKAGYRISNFNDNFSSIYDRINYLTNGLKKGALIQIGWTPYADKALGHASLVSRIQIMNHRYLPIVKLSIMNPAISGQEVLWTSDINEIFHAFEIIRR